MKTDRGNRNAKMPLDAASIVVVQNMKKCGRNCPAFILCPLMPLAIQPKRDADRICLVNLGDDRLKVAYYKMFVGGQDGIVQMMQSTIMEYGKVLQDAKLLPKDRLRALEKFNIMLDKLHQKMNPAKKPGGGKIEANDEMDEVILIASKNDAKPDPESLEHSPLLEQLIQHEPMNPMMPREKPAEPERDLAKELIDKFFPEKD